MEPVNSTHGDSHGVSQSSPSLHPLPIGLPGEDSTVSHATNKEDDCEECGRTGPPELGVHSNHDRSLDSQCCGSRSPESPGRHHAARPSVLSLGHAISPPQRRTSRLGTPVSLSSQANPGVPPFSGPVPVVPMDAGEAPGPVRRPLAMPYPPSGPSQEEKTTFVEGPLPGGVSGPPRGKPRPPVRQPLGAHGIECCFRWIPFDCSRRICDGSAPPPIAAQGLEAGVSSPCGVSREDRPWRIALSYRYCKDRVYASDEFRVAMSLYTELLPYQPFTNPQSRQGPGTEEADVTSSSEFWPRTLWTGHQWLACPGRGRNLSGCDHFNESESLEEDLRKFRAGNLAKGPLKGVLQPVGFRLGLGAFSSPRDRIQAPAEKGMDIASPFTRRRVGWIWGFQCDRWETGAGNLFVIAVPLGVRLWDGSLVLKAYRQCIESSRRMDRRNGVAMSLPTWIAARSLELATVLMERYAETAEGRARHFAHVDFMAAMSCYLAEAMVRSYAGHETGTGEVSNGYRAFFAATSHLEMGNPLNALGLLRGAKLWGLAHVADGLKDVFRYYQSSSLMGRNLTPRCLAEDLVAFMKLDGPIVLGRLLEELERYGGFGVFAGVVTYSSVIREIFERALGQLGPFGEHTISELNKLSPKSSGAKLGDVLRFHGERRE